MAIARRVSETSSLLFEETLVPGDVEGRAQVVLGRGVLVKAPYQVRNGGREIVVSGDGRVEQYRVALTRQRPGFGVGHALEHLDVELSGYAAPFGEFECPGHVEEIVARGADSQKRCVRRAQRDVEEPQVAGVHLGLRVVGGRSPAVKFGLDVFHREVRSLDEADLDHAASRDVTHSSPSDQFVQRIVGIWKVRLEYDARVHCVELGLAEHGSERLESQTKITVLLQVEVDESRGRLSLAVENAQFGAHPSARTRVVEGRQLTDDRRHLDRDVGDVGSAHHGNDARQSVVGLSFTEHRFAEHVDVER